MHATCTNQLRDSERIVTEYDIMLNFFSFFSSFRGEEEVYIFCFTNQQFAQTPRCIHAADNFMAGNKEHQVDFILTIIANIQSEQVRGSAT